MPEPQKDALSHEQQAVVRDVFSAALTVLQNQGELANDIDRAKYRALLEGLVARPETSLFVAERKTLPGSEETISVVDNEGRFAGNTITLKEDGWSVILSSSRERRLPKGRANAVFQIRVVTRSLSPQSSEDITRYASALPDVIGGVSEKSAEQAAQIVPGLRRHLETVVASTKLSETSLVLQQAWYDPENARVVTRPEGVINCTDRIGDTTEVTVSTAGRRQEHSITPVTRVSGAAQEALGKFLTKITSRG